ncbi:MAG: hypothetical protein AB8B94_15850 [Hyphomicrobiales bacterium]
MTIRNFFTSVLTALSILFGSSHAAFAWFGSLAVNGDVDISDAGGTRLCQISFLATGFVASGKVIDSNTLATTTIGGIASGNAGGGLQPSVTVADIKTCGFTNVTNLTQTHDGVGPNYFYDDVTNIELTFQAVHPLNATIVPKAASLPSFTSDGSSIYAYVFKLSGLAGAAPTLTITRTLISSSGSSSSQLIADFLLARGNHIINNQPSVIEFVDGTRESADFSNFQIGVTGYQQAARFSVSRRELENKETVSASAPSGQAYQSSNNGKTDRTGKWDFWTELKAARTDQGTSDTNTALGFAGGHYFVSDQFLVGVLAQFDWAKQTNSSVNSTVKGTGWMVGPYAAGKVTDQNLFYEARAAWGQSDNKISPSGTTEDAFNTTRWLISGKLSGDIKRGEYTIKPTLFVSYFEEEQAAYTDSAATAIAAQTVSLGEIKFGPNVTHKFTTEDDTVIQTKIGFSGIYNFGVNGNSSNSTLSNGGLRARLDGAVTASFKSGKSLSLNGYYDGVGASNFETYGGGIKISIPFQ